MNNSITLGVVRNIATEFDLPVHIDEIEQDLKNGCFLITPLTDIENHIINNRYQRQYDFMVQYFPKAKRKYRTECNDVSDKLKEVLGLIKIKDEYIRNSGSMTAEINDGILNFKVTYKPQVFKVLTLTKDEETELMGYLTQRVNLKE